jgi:phosphatidylglycerophosphate synthase
MALDRGDGAAVRTVQRLVRAMTDGPANRVTFVRFLLTLSVLGLVLWTWVHGEPARGPIVGLSFAVLVLDGVDGRVARRTGTVSGFGARFDMETDALLILVLSTLLVGPLGWWVLGSGAARYLLWLAQRLWPWLTGPIPARRWRKAVAVVQGFALMIGVSDVLPRLATYAVVGGALALLVVSFATEVHERAVRTGRDLRPGLLTAAALVLVWVCLALPSRSAALSGWALLRIPVEGLVLVGVTLVLPRRPGRFLAALVGLVVAALLMLKTLDLGFAAVLDRPFSPLTDWTYLGSGVGVLGDSIGRVPAIGATVLAVAAMVALVLLLPWASARVCGVAGEHRRGTGRVLGVLALLAVFPAVLGSGPTAGGGLAAATTARFAVGEVEQVRAELADREVFARRITEDAWASVPARQRLARLRGHDVLVVFVESYGRVAVQGTSYAPGIDRLLDRGTSRLETDGYQLRSAFLTSPTFGAGSWLAHSTLQSGLWVDSQGRYQQLLSSDRLTLSRAFGAAGWRTVLDVPADTRDWPEGQRFYRPDAMLDSRNVGYRGPKFDYAPVPDQYTLQWLDQHELTPAPRPPVMAEVDLVSSHHPWAPLPHLVPWSQLGDGSVFDPMPAQGDSAEEVFRDSRRVQAAYAQSIRYSLKTLVGFLHRLRHRDPGLVVLMLGDHQPHSYVTGADPGHQVPATILSRDPAVIDRISGWDWQPGLRPLPGAPVWGMHAVRDQIFDAFSR